jgi:hypothetical protein
MFQVGNERKNDLASGANITNDKILVLIIWFCFILFDFA